MPAQNHLDKKLIKKSKAILNQSDNTHFVNKRLAWAMLLRIGVITVLLGATFVLNYNTISSLNAPSPKFLLGVIASTYFLTIIYALWYRTGKNIFVLSRIQFIIDSFLWGTLVYATGGIVSGFTFLFDLWVIVAAIILGGRAAFIFAAISSLTFIVLAILIITGVLPLLSDQLSTIVTIKETLYFLSVNIVSLFLVAALVSSLVNRLEITKEGLKTERIRGANLSALHSDMIRSLPVGLATTDNNGKIITINPRGYEILGVKNRNIEEQNIAKWIPVFEKQLSHFENTKHNITSEININGHDVGHKADGKQIPLEYSINNLLNADKNVNGKIVIFNDLTDVKKLEAELEKTRKLAALGELAASLAHEIRNPLSAVSGSFQMLVNHPGFDKEDKSLSSIILREINRIEQLLNDMLDYARPKEPKKQNVDLVRICREIIKAFKVGTKAENLNITLTIDNETTAFIDESQLKQVLWNLLQNAAQAAGKNGEIIVTVKNERGHPVLQVEDNGHGVSKSDRKKVFNPFYSTKQRGLGLGLSICNKIIESHNGNIELKQSNSGGALFKIIFTT